MDVNDISRSHQLIQTDLEASKPLPECWTDELAALDEDAREMIRAWADNRRRILRRMRAMMEHDARFEQPF